MLATPMLFKLFPDKHIIELIFYYYTQTILHIESTKVKMGKRELIALLNLSFWCLVMVERLFLAVPMGYLQFVIVIFPDHTQLLFFFSIVNIYILINSSH